MKIPLCLALFILLHFIYTQQPQSSSSYSPSFQFPGGVGVFGIGGAGGAGVVGIAGSVPLPPPNAPTPTFPEEIPQETISPNLLPPIASPFKFETLLPLDVKKILEYWTPERRAAAISPFIVKAEDQSFEITTQPISLGEIENNNTAMLPDEYYQLFPYKLTGKVFTTLNNTHFKCSASVVGENLTGHCVSNFGKWAQSLTFYPAYKDNNSPFGGWAGKYIGTFEEWSKGRTKHGRDIAFVIMHPNEKGQSVGSVVGQLDIKACQTGENIMIIGFPQNFADGEKMVYTVNPMVDEDDAESPNTDGVISAMNIGASGGPFISTADFKACGVVSYMKRHRPGILYSPKFDKEVLNLKDLISKIQ